jgi:hypothetical protein
VNSAGNEAHWRVDVEPGTGPMMENSSVPGAPFESEYRAKTVRCDESGCVVTYAFVAIIPTPELPVPLRVTVLASIQLVPETCAFQWNILPGMPVTRQIRKPSRTQSNVADAFTEAIDTRPPALEPLPTCPPDALDWLSAAA